MKPRLFPRDDTPPAPRTPAAFPEPLAAALAVLALFLFAVVWTSPALAQAQGGNKVLMEQWARQKQQTKDKVYQELKRQGAVPRNGTIVFVATMKPDPANPGQAKVHVDSVTVNETQTGRTNTATDPIFGPRDSGGPVHQNGTIDAGQVRETIRIVNGVPQ